MQIQRVIEVEDVKNSPNIVETMKIPLASSSSSEKTNLEIGKTINRSFLHGQDGGKLIANGGDNANKSINERVIYATLDSLALKRARLPLQLVPIDENAVGSDDNNKNDIKNIGEKRINRKTSPKRPSFKIRPGVPVSSQWKSRARSSPRLQSVGKPENTPKDLASRLIIFENIIRNNNQTISPQNNSIPIEPQKIQLSTKPTENSTENTKNPKEPQNPKKSIPPPENNEKTKFKEQKNLTISKKPEKSDFDFARNVLHSFPITSRKRPKKSKNHKKKDKSPKTNLEASRSFSREELRVSISLPTNFVHLASATNSKLLPNGGKSKGNSLKIIEHEEKFAKLDYIGDLEFRKIEIEPRKSVRKSLNEKNFGEFSSSASSSLSSFGEFENTAKVENLEKSQGVPEVVKTSENEGNFEENKNKDVDYTIAPVYEAMSEFSISKSNDEGNFIRANRSFLWGGRGSRRFENESCSNDFVDCKEETQLGDNLIEDNGDAYDDVGLSRLDTEEDHYDDVGFPSSATKNSSTNTLFEEINDADSELYDDVLPPEIQKKSPSCVKKNIDNSENSFNLSSEVKKSMKMRENSSVENFELSSNDENQYLSISNDYSSVEENLDDFEKSQDDDLYDDVELPCQDRVNSLYAGSSSGSQLGSLCNGKESEWEDLEEAAPVLPLPKKNNVAMRNSESQGIPTKKKSVQRWSRKVRRQKSKGSRKNPSSRSTSRTARGTSTFFDTASDDSNYETLCSFPSDEFSSGSDDENLSTKQSLILNEFNQNNETNQEAPSRPVPPPPRECSLTETFGKRMKMLRRTWSITKGSLGRMRRRSSAATETETSPIDDGGKFPNVDQPSPNNDGKKYFSFKKHFRKSITGLSTFYLENENVEERLSRNNNRSKEEVYSNCSDNSWYTNTDYWKNSVSEQTQRNDIDHYSMLDEEPLYQFYAAAAARVAFESDSEGYEEVEDPLQPSPSAADLAKPGHRTLWCQTPQIVNSDLLQRLSPDEKKLQEAKFEIFTSEASYLNSLRVLVDEFLNNHELVYEVLTPSEREKLFGGVPTVLLASERLLAELETIWREDVMLQGLPDVLLNYAQRSSSVYVAYCSNQVSIDTTLKELRSKKGSKFVETVSRIETHPACQSLSLHSFLMLPMQRVTRLPLLADAVLSKLSSDSKEERTCWECVLSQLSQVVMECNEGARAAGRLAEMEALERKLEYSSKVPPIVLRDRYLVRRGPVVQMLAKADAEYKLTFGKKYHKASLYLLLLTDYLLIAKPKSNTNEETFTVVDTCKRSLVALEKVPEDSPFAGRHAMILSLLENYSGRHVEYILTCNNATERERWLDAISPPKPSLVGETLYETWDCPQVMALYPYAPAQPDELTLQPGDVINVLRKMTDGWHLGEKLLGGEQGWFPGNYAKEVASEHVRARNLRQRHRLLALSASVMQQLAKQSRIH